MSGGRVASEQDATLVRIETDDGLVGWGEQCVFSPNFLSAHGGGARATLELLAPAVVGADPRQVEVVYARMDAAVKGHPYAKSAIDIACWDLLGKTTGLRVGDLLGGIFQDEFPLYTGIGIAAPEEMRRRTEEALDAGYRQLQLKVGTDWREDVERVESCLELLGGAERVIVDANGFWTQADATRFVAAVADHDVYIEQPCATIEECAQVRRRSRRPFVLDESLTDLAALERGREAADAVRLKLSQFGGITPLRKARDLAAAWGLAMTLEDSGGGDVVTAATAHLSCSVQPRLLLNGFLVGEMVNERFAAGAPRAVDGRARLPAGPGLGVEVDEAALGEPVFRVG
ncbi:MAG: mandelate racemase/muconate lactonizing enzyme family protein [Thermoleophilia bacterium]|nr:mandelate racemase/muconate lactonizing enzyme family protein [Thermoleophilia bacterium]